MSFTLLTPYMNLTLPIPTEELGPDWATELNSALATVDSHSHVPGQGVQIPVNGLNINADFPLNSFNLTLARSLRMVNAASPLGLASDVTCLYAAGGDLWYNNANGQQVKVTSGSTINVSSTGTIGGDYGSPGVPAAVDYFITPANTYYFYQDTNQYAPIAVGPVTISGTSASANGITLFVSPSLSTPFSIQLPTALPSTQKFMTLDAGGNIEASWVPDNSTIVSSGNVVRVPTSGITTAQIADNSVTRVKIVQSAQQISSSCGTFSSGSASDITNLSITYSTNGNPVFIGMISDGTSGGYIRLNNAGGNLVNINLKRNGSTIAFNRFESSGPTIAWPASSVYFIDTPSAGTYTYTWQADPQNSSWSIVNVKMVVYEII